MVKNKTPMDSIANVVLFGARLWVNIERVKATQNAEIAFEDKNYDDAIKYRITEWLLEFGDEQLRQIQQEIR